MTDIFASVWTPDLTTQLAVIPNRKTPTWQDPLNGAGTGSLRVPFDDPAAVHLKARNIVRFHYAGGYRYAFRIQQPSNVVVETSGDTDRWLTVTGPGVGDVFNDAVLYPEYGLTRNAVDQRGFTYASAVGAWYVSSEWAAPLGVLWTADTTDRLGDPADWKDPTASWIWDTDPDATDTDLKVVYFRASFTVATHSMVAIHATADNFFDLYLDGQQILASDITDPLTWRRTSIYTVNLPAGTYLLAARVQNAAKAWSTQLNPGAFLCTVFLADSKGNPTSVLMHTNTTDWLCRPEGTTPPGWHAAQVLKTFITEAQARGVTAMAPLTLDFTDTHDTNSVAWTDIVARTFNVGTKGADLIEQLTELTIDVAVGPDLVIHAWTERGTDKSTGPGAVVLRPALNLAKYQVDTDLKITTRLLVRTPNGWLETAASNEGTDGRIEDLLSLGNAASDVQASQQAVASFDDVAHPLAKFTATCLPVAGATPYLDFGLGDTVLAPDGDGGLAKLRVMSISVSEDENGDVSFVPELYQTGTVAPVEPPPPPPPGSWTVGTAAPVALEEPACVGYAGRVYVFAGEATDAAVNIYDPTTDTWTTGTSSPSGLSPGSAVVIGSLIYVVSYNGDKLFSYDPAADTWVNLSAGIPTIPNLFASRLCACTDGSKIYMLVDADTLGDHLPSGRIYDPGTATWDTTTIPKVPSAVAPNGVGFGSIAFIGGDLIFVNGWASSAAPDGVVGRFDFTAGTWTSGATDSDPAEDYPLNVADLNVIVTIGGDTDTVNARPTVRIYHPATDTWTRYADLNVSRSYAGAAVCGGRLYVIGGDDAGGSAITSVEWAPATDFT